MSEARFPANPSAIELLEEIRKLLELKGENPFKIRAYDRAIEVLSGRDDLVERARAGTLTELHGIGKGISEVLTEFLLQGTSQAREELRASLPPGLLELTAIPGVGPKKAQLLIEELGIQSVGELEYACRENRLMKLKGFGAKIQQKILEGIIFKSAQRGRQRLGDAFPVAERLFEALCRAARGGRVSETGALRRRLETLAELEFILELPSEPEIAGAVREQAEKVVAASAGLPVRLHFCGSAEFGYELARTTGSEEHWKALGAPERFAAEKEEDFYRKLGLPWIPPETRERGEEVGCARAGGLDRLVGWNALQGIFHCHTTRSDGVATLEEMVAEARRRGFRYIGISDHSRSAFYANGLTAQALVEQEKEIRRAREKFPDMRIFWGIESDILVDGSLDYEPDVLRRFDFVIASIHSRFGMDRATMTNRILEAIRNPHTRFLGHMTGRLLLDRQGYELEAEAIIAEAARHDVAIEINSHPARLDIDWRWGQELRKHGTLVSINPDAHEAAGLADTRYGLAMARKALLPGEQVLNSRSAQEVEKWLKRQ